MKAFWDAHAVWSQETFGSDAERDHVGPLRHLQLEVTEALYATDKADLHEEIVDCLFLTVDAARRAGMTYEEFLTGAWTKLARFASQERGKRVDGMPVEHIREGE